MTYGLPTGTRINYGGPGFPQWVYDLAAAFSVKGSTYPGHQENDRLEKGFARNLQRLNRGIDFVGSQADMQRFASWLLTQRQHLEQLIFEDSRGKQYGVAGGDDVSLTAYYGADMAGHRDHVHVRVSKPIPLPNQSQEQPVSWTGDPIWLADVLKAQKPALKVAELPDWQQYGHGDYGRIWGVMVHHTGNARADAMSIRNGRPDLQGPLSNLHIAQDGTVTVVAAGVCWHAGRGSYPGISTDGGNQVLIGIECAWPRDTSITPATQLRERWPDSQIIAMRDSVAAILTRLGLDSSRVIGHKEYAGRAQGKWDPGNLSMDWFRGEVAKAQRGEFKPLAPKPEPSLADLSDRQLLEAVYLKLVTS